MRALTGLAAALAACMLAACGGSSDEAAPNAAATDQAPASAGREQAPAIDGQSLEGEAISLGDFRGRPVLVNVWSSW